MRKKKIAKMRPFKKVIAGALMVSMIAGSGLNCISIKAEEPEDVKTINIDFSKRKGEMKPKVGWLLIPNENVTDGRIVPLNTQIIRDDIETQNLIWNNSDKDKKESHLRDIGTNEQNRLDRIRDGVERMSELGIDYYPIMGYFPSWVSATGYAQAKPKNMEVYKQWIRDIAQYVKDNDLPIDKFNVWNEDWGFYGGSGESTYNEMHETAWYAMHEVFQDVDLIGPSMQESPEGRAARLIKYCAEKEITADILSWHFDNDSINNVKNLENTANQYPIAGDPEYYLEEYAWDWENGALAFNILAQADSSDVDAAIRGIWEYPNGMSELIKTNQDEEIPNYRLCEWWQLAAYGSMTGESVVNDSSPYEPYIASIDEEKGEAKVLISNQDAQNKSWSSTEEVPMNLYLNNLPFEGNITIDKYLITKSSVAGDTGGGASNAKYAMNRDSIWDEDEGIKYQGSESAVIDKSGNNSTLVNFGFEGHDVYMLVIKTDKAVPSDFYLRLPDDNTVTDKNPELKWEKSQGAESYTVTVARDKKMEDVVYTAEVDAAADGIEETHKVTMDLPSDQMYYWTVTAHNQNGNRAPFNNMYYSFTVKDNVDVPGAFTIYQPVNYTDEVPLTPRFTWSECRNADSYTIEISENKDFSGDVITEKVTNPTYVQVDKEDLEQQPWSKELNYWEYTIQTQLKPGTTYYTRMTAENENGFREMDGKVHEFTTTSADGTPDSFALTYPVDNTVLEQRETLRWEDNAGAFFFELEVATDPEFENIVIKHDTITVPAYTLESNVLEPGTQYYWRVTATNKDKSAKTENDGGVHTFTTSDVPAAPLVKVSNPTGAGSIVVWQPVLGADSYTVKVGSESGKYTEEYTGLTGERAYVPTDEACYCTVVAVKDGKESQVWNEIKLREPYNVDMVLGESYEAEAADSIQHASIEMENSTVYVEFKTNGDSAEYNNAIPCKELVVNYQADSDTKVSIYAGDEKLGELELNQTDGQWEQAALSVNIEGETTLKFIKEGNGGAFRIDSFIPSEGVILQDIAKNSTITADSETSGFGEKENAIDDDRQTFWRADVPATEEEPNWLNVDFGKIWTVHKVNIKLPTEGWGTRTQEIRILTSENGTDYVEASAKTAYEFDNTKNGNEVTISLEHPVEAQHVKVEFYSNTGDPDYGQVGTLEVMAAAGEDTGDDVDGKNLALNKTVTTEDESYGKPGDIVDGDLSTFADFGAVNFPNEVIVDLGQIYALDRFEMYLPTGWGSRTQEIEFLSSLDGKTYTPLVEKANYTFEKNVNHVTVTLPGNAAGRFIQIIGTANDEVAKPGLQFGEFEVYGSYGTRVEGIDIVQEKEELKAFTTLQLEVVLTPENVTNSLIAWSSSDFDVARVDSTGLVTPVAPGEAVIRARSLDGSFKDTCTVTVVKNNIVSVTDPEDMEVPYGTELTAEDLPKTLPVQLEGDVQKDLEVTWDLSSYNPEEEGTQTITGTLAETDLIGNADNVQAEVSVTVLPLHAKYEVTVENGSGSGQYEEGSTVTVKADDPAEGMKFDKWESEDVEFADAESAETTFVMPSKDVTVTATYKALPDKSALKDAIDEAEKINPDDYTTESADALRKALEEAKAVYDNADATEAEIEGAMDALNAAVEGLVKLGDKTELQAKLKDAAEVKENLSDYLTEGQEEFLKAYDAAEKVNADPEASEAEVAEVLKNLAEAMDGLTLKPDKSELADLVENAKAIDTDKYTDETVNEFRESLSIAEDVLADEEATEAEVSEAAARLANAIEQLEEKDTGNPDDGNKPGDGNNPDDGNKPGDGDILDDGNKPDAGNKPDDGDTPDDGNQSGNSSDGSNAPKTGDTTNLAGVLAVLVLSAGAAMSVLYKKKRDN